MAHDDYQLFPDMNVHDIPYSITHQICSSMDIDRGWEQLAGDIGYTMLQIKQFELEIKRTDGSPTKKLLWDWGTRGGTARELYEKLGRMKKIHAKRLLEDIVNPVKNTGNDRKEEDKKNERLREAKENGLDSLKSLGSNALNYNRDNLPKPVPPKRKVENNPREDVNLNTSKNDSKSTNKHFDDKDLKKLNPVSSGAAMRFNGIEGASFVQVNECQAAGPASGKGLMDPSSLASLERIKSHLSSCASEDCISKMSEGDEEVARAMMSTHNFTYKELAQATSGFSEMQKLGEGAFGDVYLGELRHTKCAIKKLHQRNEEGTSFHISSELTALTKYRHENIVILYGFASDTNEVCLVYQYMQNGSLEDRLNCRNGTSPLDWEKRISIMRGAACGLQFLHTVDKKPLIHGDIKSANILLDRHFEAKVGDLGLAQHATGRSESGSYTHITKKQADTRQYQCRAYQAPEVLRGNGFSVKGDAYSFGVVLFEVCTGENAYDAKREGSDQKFLADYIHDQLDENLKINCMEVFRDKKAGQCIESVFNAIFQLGTQCTNEKKKDRPDMVKVYQELEQLEFTFKKQKLAKENEQMTIEISRVTLMQPLSKQSAGNFLRPSSITSDGGYISGTSPTSHLPNTAGGVSPSQVPSYPVVGAANGLHNACSEDQLPEPWKLQLFYDKRNVISVPNHDGIDNVEKDSSDIKESSEPLNDKKKLAEIVKFDEQLRMGNKTPSAKISKFQEHEANLFESDPKKLQEMKLFDSENLTSEDHDTKTLRRIYPSDPKKLAELHCFDNDVSNCCADSANVDLYSQGVVMDGSQINKGSSVNVPHECVSTEKNLDDDSMVLHHLPDPQESPFSADHVQPMQRREMMALFEQYEASYGNDLEGDYLNEMCDEQGQFHFELDIDFSRVNKQSEQESKVLTEDDGQTKNCFFDEGLQTVKQLDLLSEHQQTLAHYQIGPTENEDSTTDEDVRSSGHEPCEADEGLFGDE
ncbi:hypothetical protein CHS0354_016131 [Potamilus streckersoni]|uniref:non-specific serine/threonine protein kinase n=1 Tax=Potamilus streckersoni TaxID=2493646 RepID=A0AAE0W5F7_9BIVA|nr:hypothetical protein CHS0354_016131 [Potamilus streckersoni]